jgi:hypothetical protein
MARKGRTDESREPGGYSALPWSVIDSRAYQALSCPAKALLIEIARQYVRDNNGRLLASSAYLAKRGWRSRDVITRAKAELIDAQLIYQTVQGHRPNKASWYPFDGPRVVFGEAVKLPPTLRVRERVTFKKIPYSLRGQGAM